MGIVRCRIARFRECLEQVDVQVLPVGEFGLVQLLEDTLP